jgi:hypothetical protein
MKDMKLPTMAVLFSAFAVLVFPLAAQTKTSYAGVGFIGLSPNLSDTLSSYSLDGTLYGGTVGFALNPWLTVGTDVLYLGDIYYGKDSEGNFFGPVSWATLKAGDPSATDKASRKYYESMIYAPLTFNLTIPLGFVKPYVGAGPAFYFHFPSTNQTPDFAEYLRSRYGEGGRVRTGLTFRAGLDIFIAGSFSLGAGYILREDIPARIFEHVSDPTFYKENGYAFLTAKFVLR